jgi:hypothetical protein
VVLPFFLHLLEKMPRNKFLTDAEQIKIKPTNIVAFLTVKLPKKIIDPRMTTEIS